MKKILIAVLLLCSVSTVAHADEASRREKVTKLVELMHLDRMMDQIMTSMKAQAEQQMKSAPGMDEMTPEQKKITDKFMDKIMNLATSTVGWKALEPKMVDVYAKDLTDEEIDGMLVFYSSSVGQSMLAKMPQMTQDMMGSVQATMADLQPKMNDLIKEYVAEMAKASTKSSTPNAQKKS